MNCSQWEERIALSAGGDVRDAEVERHIAECLWCQMLADGLRESLEVLRSAHREEIAAAHYTAVRGRVLAELEHRRAGRVWGWLFAACAAVVFGVLVAPLWRTPIPPPPAVALAHPPAPVLVPAVATREVLPVRARQAAVRAKATPSEPVLVRLVSNDPDVVIYWIADTKGE